MGTLATVGIDDNLATRQSRIAVRSTNDKLACGINVVLDVVAEEVEHLL